MRLWYKVWTTVWVLCASITYLCTFSWKASLALLVMAAMLALLFWWLMVLADRPDPSQSEDYDLWQVPDKRDIPK